MDANGWQPIETAPKDERTILLYGKDYCPRGWTGWKPERDIDHPIAGGWFVRSGYFSGGLWQTGRLWGFEPTHWMPLPPPPGDTNG